MRASVHTLHSSIPPTAPLYSTSYMYGSSSMSSMGQCPTISGRSSGVAIVNACSFIYFLSAMTSSYRSVGTQPSDPQPMPFRNPSIISSASLCSSSGFIVLRTSAASITTGYGASPPVRVSQDWQHAPILPLFLLAGLPQRFQKYDDPISQYMTQPSLPKDFDDLSESKKSGAKEVYRRRARWSRATSNQ
ncbi:hypothetical protein BD311DRAFT_175220 [Dichomitus squalens]|uniref:Uncharacterized protein n=1 Tax=Dichomitus squalens TaxID=114155 RepID=A0A4Q9MSM3_9APHY|nr:hypothetical protein BD311DRAFT_175220 [Dichomitus squalens]